MNLRSILAVIAGFLLVPVVALACDLLVVALRPGAFDAHGYAHSPVFLLLAMVYTAGAQILGGYVTARLACRRPLLHASILGGVALLLTIPVSLAHWHDAPAWYHIVTWVLTLPACWLGASFTLKPATADAACTPHATP